MFGVSVSARVSFSKRAELLTSAGIGEQRAHNTALWCARGWQVIVFARHTIVPLRCLSATHCMHLLSALCMHVIRHATPSTYVLGSHCLCCAHVFLNEIVLLCEHERTEILNWMRNYTETKARKSPIGLCYYTDAIASKSLTGCAAIRTSMQRSLNGRAIMTTTYP